MKRSTLQMIEASNSRREEEKKMARQSAKKTARVARQRQRIEQTREEGKLMYKISDNVPIPKVYSSLERFPLGDLEPGQSFGFPMTEFKSLERAKLHYQREHEGSKFTIRRNVDGKDEGRIWRVT